jgi:hypothetical protein
MCENKPLDAAEYFGDVVSTYTRAQAIEDGVLVDVTQTAKEAGFRWPTALTRYVWNDCVAWSKDDNKRQVYQDESGRLWDVLWMAFSAIDQAPGNGAQLEFHLLRVPRGGKRMTACLTTLKLVVGPGDQGEPVVTIMLPGES